MGVFFLLKMTIFIRLVSLSLWGTGGGGGGVWGEKERKKLPPPPFLGGGVGISRTYQCTFCGCTKMEQMDTVI